MSEKNNANAGGDIRKTLAQPRSIIASLSEDESWERFEILRDFVRVKLEEVLVMLEEVLPAENFAKVKPPLVALRPVLKPEFWEQVQDNDNSSPKNEPGVLDKHDKTQK